MGIKKIGLMDIVVHLILLMITISILYPLLHVVAISFSDNYSIMANKVFVLPKGFNLDSYKHVFASGKVIGGFRNSLIYTMAGVTINVLMTVVMAYPLSKRYLIGRSFFVKMVMFTMFFSGGMIPTFLIVKELHLLNTLWSLVLPNAIWTMELIIMINFFRSIPDSLYEAAYLDGASEFQVLLKVAVPLSKASVATIGLNFFMGHWSSYYLPMLYLNDSDKFPLQLVLRAMLMEAQEMEKDKFIGEGILTPAGVKNATIVIAMIPVMIIYPHVQKYFVKGVMIGSIKE